MDWMSDFWPWADNATIASWAAAIATFFTGIVAAALGLKEGRQRRRDRQIEAESLTAFIKPEGEYAIQRLNALITGLDTIPVESLGQDQITLALEVLRSLADEQLLRGTEAHTSRLPVLGSDRACAFARALGSIPLLTEAMRMAAVEPSIDAGNRALIVAGFTRARALAASIRDDIKQGLSLNNAEFEALVTPALNVLMKNADRFSDLRSRFDPDTGRFRARKTRENDN